MQTLQAQIGTAPNAIGVKTGSTVELAPGLRLPAFNMRFDRNEEIFAEEEAADFVYKVISGAVRDVRILSDGRRQIGAFHMSGEAFGLECGETHRHTAEAVVDSEVALIRRSALNKAGDADPMVARKLWDLTSTDFRRLQDHMVLLSRKSALERVASFLLGLSARNPSAGTLELPMSRNDIADYLGLTIETVSRTFTQLERDRAISMPAARRIVLHERLALTGD